MKNRHGEPDAPAELIRPVLLGALAGAAVTFAALTGFALLFTLRDLPASAAAPFAVCAAGLGALAAGFTAARLHKRRGLLAGALTGALLFAAVQLVALLVGGAGMTALTAVRLGVMTLAAAVGGVIGVNSASKRKMV